MSYFNTEKAIAELDYNLKKESIDKELDKTLQDISNVLDEGFWFDEIKIDDVEIHKIFININGITLFSKFDKELTDESLWEDAKKIYDTVSNHFKDIESQNITLYLLLNPPIVQYASYGLYQPCSEYVIPIKGLKLTLEADLNQKEIIWSEDELLSFITDFTSQLEDFVLEDEEVIGDYIKVRGKFRVHSDIDPDKYFNLALYGGIIGLHKFYTRSYLNFICYLFTLGYFGIGWAVDLIEIYLGISKDKRRAYIGPFGDRKKFIFVPIIIYLVVFIYFLFIL